MRTFILCISLSAFIAVGCAGKKAAVPPATAKPAAATPNYSLIVTPDNALVGRVVKVNPNERFVVLNFPIGHLPALDQHLFLYRNGLKVGAVNVTGPQRDDNIVADILTGDAQDGDEVRDK